MGRGVPYSYNQAIKETLPAQMKNSDINAIYDDNCKLRMEKVTITSILNKYFTSIGKKIQKLFTITPMIWTESSDNKNPSKFQLQSVTYDYVEQELNKLETSKAAGLDKISTRLLKDTASVIAPVLTNLINKSLLVLAFLKGGNLQRYLHCLKMEKELRKRTIDLYQSYRRSVKLSKGLHITS